MADKQLESQGEKTDIVELVELLMRKQVATILDAKISSDGMSAPHIRNLKKIWFLENRRYFRGLLINAIESVMAECEADHDPKILSRHLSSSLKELRLVKNRKELGKITDVTLVQDPNTEEVTVKLTLCYYEETYKRERHMAVHYDELLAEYEFLE